MTLRKDTLWSIERHTKAKHDILDRYLGAWFGIMGKMNRKVIYIDGFCGPGRHKGGEPGSPIIILKNAINHNSKGNITSADFFFIENRKDRAEILREELDKLTIPQNFQVRTYLGDFEDKLPEVMQVIFEENGCTPPIFVFIDPFGFKGCPFEIVKGLLRNQKTEVFINIMAGWINRFVDHPDEHITTHINDLYGTDDVLTGGITDEKRIISLRDKYFSQLSSVAKFVCFFEMRDENHRLIYYLFFASNNELGHSKMKEAMWRIDNQTGLSFSDGIDPNQLILLSLDPSIEVSRLLTEKFGGRTVEKDEVLQYIENETHYIAKHLIQALKDLESTNKICVSPKKTDGSKKNPTLFS